MKSSCRYISCIIVAFSLTLNIPVTAQDVRSGGVIYPLGEGWTVQYTPAKTICETVSLGRPSTRLQTIPATYRWAKLAAGVIPEPLTELVTVPPQYKTVVEQHSVSPARDIITITAPIYNPDGSLRRGAVFEKKTIPAEMRTVTRRVLERPARTVERIVPRQTRDGFVRVVDTPAYTVEVAGPLKSQRHCGEISATYSVSHKDRVQRHDFNNFDAFHNFLNNPPP